MFDKGHENDFDRRAEVIFKAIPAEVRAANLNKRVIIFPDADPSKGERYVFGDTLDQALEQGDLRFGLKEPGEVMSFATNDGSMPEKFFRGLRGMK